MKFSTLYLKGSIQYPGVLLRFPLALIVANYLVIYGEPETQLEFIKHDFYYRALFWSVLITSVISEFIYLVTKLLDVKYSWLTKLHWRAFTQFILGVLLPLLLIYCLVAYYFRSSDAIENYTNYMKLDFPIVICFVLFLNAYYLIVFLYKVKIIRKKIPNRHEIKTAELSTVAIIYSKKGNSFAITFDGETISWPETIEKSILQLDADAYFLISRSKIVHALSVIDYLPHQSRTLKLVFIEKLSLKSDFIVSQRRSIAFKNWYKAVKRIS